MLDSINMNQLIWIWKRNALSACSELYFISFHLYLSLALSLSFSHIYMKFWHICDVKMKIGSRSKRLKWILVSWKSAVPIPQLCKVHVMLSHLLIHKKKCPACHSFYWMKIIANKALQIYCPNIMMSWHGNAFCITGPLWGESTGGFPSQRASNAEIWYFFMYLGTNFWANS